MRKALALVSLIALAMALGCGQGDVTGASVDDAMKERAAKAKALDAKEGKPDSTGSETKGGSTGLTYDKSQDPQ